MNPDPAKVEVLKVWYSVFCTLMDDTDKHFTNDQKLQKLTYLRQLLRDAYPQLEQDLTQGRQ